jgi:hypothetical protein
LAVPAKERLQRNHGRSPTVTRERPGSSPLGTPDPDREAPAGGRPSEHLHLVTEDRVLELELGDAPLRGSARGERRRSRLDPKARGTYLSSVAQTQVRVSEPHVDHLIASSIDGALLGLRPIAASACGALAMAWAPSVGSSRSHGGFAMATTIRPTEYP